MSWCRTIHVPPAILIAYRSSRRHFCSAGNLGSIGGALSSNEAPAKYQSLTGTIKERGNLGFHFNRFASRAPTKWANGYFAVERCQKFKFFNFMGIGSSKFQFSTTDVVVSKEEVVRGLELFVSNNQNENGSTKDLCAIYIETLCRSGNLSDATYLLRYVHGKKIHLGLKLHNVLLTAASEENNFNLFCEIFKSLLFSSMAPDLSSYTKVAKAFKKVHDMDMVINFIKEVSEITCHSDPTVINRIIFVTAESGQIDRSLKIYEELKNLNCRMDKVTFNTVLGILGRSGKVNEMLSEFKLMKDLGHAPDIITYTTLINCLRRLGRLDLCKTFSREMLEEGIDMDLLTYTALIDAFGRAGHVDDALKIFAEMKKSHLPSKYVYRALISVLKKAGKLDLALDLSVEMNSGTVKLAGPEDFRGKHKGRKKY